VLGSEDIPSY